MDQLVNDIIFKMENLAFSIVDLEKIVKSAKEHGVSNIRLDFNAVGSVGRLRVKEVEHWYSPEVFTHQFDVRSDVFYINKQERWKADLIK